MQSIQIIQSFINLKDKRDVLRLHFFSKTLERNIVAYPNELEILIELYLRRGFHSKEEKQQFFEFCVSNKLRRTKQSFSNTITKYVNAGVIEKLGMCKRKISEDFIPYLETDVIGLEYKVVNIGDADTE